MIENKVVLVEKNGRGGRMSARDYDPSPGPGRQFRYPLKAPSQSTAAVDNFVGKPGVVGARGRQIKALDNLPQV
ncbi:hypothetical protein [Roseateles saccharophilus]|nr:hypothetical protein [Roseateles saccharophilus]MDG0832097.1 hypothetical protein [Roseateles saccharophilus]